MEDVVNENETQAENNVPEPDKEVVSEEAKVEETQAEAECPNCEGEGKVSKDEVCPNCNGTGKI